MGTRPLFDETIIDAPTSLLLASLRPNNSQELEQRAVSAAITDWQTAIQRAGELGVGPLFAERLNDAGITVHLADDLARRVEEIHQEGVLNNLQAFQSLDRILAVLAERQIPVIPLKGAYLVEKVYQQVGMRAMGDIDILIRMEDLNEAVRILDEIGCRASYPFQVEAEIEQMHAMPVLEPDLGLTVDLHWTLVAPTAPFHIPVEKIWQSAESGNLRGFAVREMTAEDLLLHLCLHAAYLDGFSSGLRPLCDIAWTIQAFQEKLDWTKLNEKAHEWGIGRSAWLALKTAERLLDARLPEGGLGSLQPGNDDLPVLEWAIAQVLWPSGMSRKLAGVWAPNPWRRRVGLLLRNLFPARHEMRQFYPKLGRGLLWPFAYLVHLGRVFQRNWRSAGRLFGADPHMRAAAVQSEQANILLKWQEGAKSP